MEYTRDQLWEQKYKDLQKIAKARRLSVRRVSKNELIDLILKHPEKDDDVPTNNTPKPNVFLRIPEKGGIISVGKEVNKGKRYFPEPPGLADSPFQSLLTRDYSLSGPLKRVGNLGSARKRRSTEEFLCKRLKTSVKPSLKEYLFSNKPDTSNLNQDSTCFDNRSNLIKMCKESESSEKVLFSSGNHPVLKQVIGSGKRKESSVKDINISSIKKSRRTLNETFEIDDEMVKLSWEDTKPLNETLGGSNKKNKSCVKDKNVSSIKKSRKTLNETFEIDDEMVNLSREDIKPLNQTLGKDSLFSSIKKSNKVERKTLNETFDKSCNNSRALNETFDKSCDKTRVLNETFDKSPDNNGVLNQTFDKSGDNTRALNETFDKNKSDTFLMQKIPTSHRHSKRISTRTLNESFDNNFMDKEINHFINQPPCKNSSRKIDNLFGENSVKKRLTRSQTKIMENDNSNKKLISSKGEVTTPRNRRNLNDTFAAVEEEESTDINASEGIFYLNKENRCDTLPLGNHIDSNITECFMNLANKPEKNVFDETSGCLQEITTNSNGAAVDLSLEKYHNRKLTDAFYSFANKNAENISNVTIEDVAVPSDDSLVLNYDDINFSNIKPTDKYECVNHALNETQKITFKPLKQSSPIGQSNPGSRIPLPARSDLKKPVYVFTAKSKAQTPVKTPLRLKKQEVTQVVKTKLPVLKGRYTPNSSGYRSNRRFELLMKFREKKNA